MDNHTKSQRSYNMSQIKGRNTGAEVRFRRELFKKGIKGYRISVKIPGKPDIVFTRLKLAIFVDGCFWHKCPNCFSFPKSNRTFWKNKIEDNVLRDKTINKELKRLGFKVLRIWEHDLEKDMRKCVNKVETRLNVLKNNRN